MHWRPVMKVIGALSLAIGLAMVLPLVVGLIYADGSTAHYFKAMLITIACGAGSFLIFRKAATDHLTTREGMAIVALGWMAIGLFGALPFYFEGPFPTFADALFESVSGFTTTGSSVLTAIEELSHGALFWRSLIQWIGGMGIIVLSIAILPFLGVGGMQLYKAEVPSPVPDKLQPRIRDTAALLWKVYLLFTVVETLLLWAGGMSFYDAVCHALTTMPTGGFSTKNASMAHFDSVYMDIVVIVFMVLAGINFSLHYQLLRGKPFSFWQDAECRAFLAIVLVLSLVITFDIWREVYAGLAESLRYALFQVVSIMTTTGFATADYEQWPAMSQVVILVCMFLGASAGSTGGGMKILRIMLCFKFCYKELFSLIHPHSVSHVKIGGKPVPDDILRSVFGFLALYLLLFAICAILLAGLGVDFTTAIGAVASSIGNIGPGFGTVGPVENYAEIPYMGKWLLIWCMLLGRLEIYTVIILLVPEFYRK
ncbi:MAG: TrkH family potassium uptake protein [Desulfobacterales bacterium]|nr:TrkH family potassium uptake protein [Desulfobacterales bacterium]